MLKTLALVAIVSLVLLAGCQGKGVDTNTPTPTASNNITSILGPSKTASPSPSAVSQPSPNPPNPQMTKVGPKPPDPRDFRIDITASFSKKFYLPGDSINASIDFTDKDNEAAIIDPFPPSVDILMPSLPGQDVVSQYTIQSIKAGNEAVTLQPGESKTYGFNWDGKKSGGEQAVPGWHQLYVMPFGKKASQLGSSIAISQDSVGMLKNFLIQYPQGALNKVIAVNQTKTIPGLHIRWGDFNILEGWFDNYKPGYDYVVDVSITLQRIELNDQGISIFAVVTSPNLPPISPNSHLPKYENPWFDKLPPASWSVDGVVKNARTPAGQYLDDGVFWKWGTMPDLRSLIPLDPIPNGAKEFAFRIPQFGEWQGPWEFNIPLQ